MNDITAHTGGLFGNGDQTGSIQVITISLPYIVKEVMNNGGNFKDIIDRIYYIMNLIRDEQL
jgi:hypothetical protein